MAVENEGLEPLSRVAIVAFGAVSALGEGAAAASVGEVGAPARVAIARDEELERAGLLRPFAARSGPRVWSGPDDDLRATVILERALAGCVSELDRVRPSWRRQRVGMVLGTSCGGMRSAERAFAAIERGERVVDVEAPTYFGPLARAARGLGMPLDPAMLVLGACASSAIAIGLASRWLECGACDVALAGGFDDVTVFVAAGFEALRATTASPPPRPFRVGRDGMSLGEGAAVLALALAEMEASDAGASVYVAGFGAASDAVHLTAPDRDGGGLTRAARAALNEAGSPRVDLVSAHATATAFNDAAESRAIARALGAGRARDVVVHPFKAQIGHTLGAAGALETLACLDAIVRGILPAAAGEGAVDHGAPARLLSHATASSPRTALKLASAFGGANAALVIAAAPPTVSRSRRTAFLHAAVHLEHELPFEALAMGARTSVDRLARADGLVRLALGAVARLERATGSLAGAGIVVGSALSTIETNSLFAARLRQFGARAVEPRRFPYTSPNAAPGECSIAFGLTGPSFAVGGGLHAAVEAFAAGALLIEAGDAERIVVVAVDEAGPVTRAVAGEGIRSGAVALLLSVAGAGARARVGATTLRRGPPVSGPLVPGHLALVPLVAPKPPSAIVSTSPPDMFARVVLHPI
jgi:3-oxoacyl-[acyl-carrier-protein] synthase II